MRSNRFGHGQTPTGNPFRRSKQRGTLQSPLVVDDAPSADQNALKTAARVIDGKWGYACVEDGAVFIPAVQATADWPLRRVLAHLYQQTGLTKMIFSAILNPDDLRPRLRNIVREYDHYVEEMEDVSRCIEITYEPATKVDAVDPGAGTQESSPRA